MGDLGKLLSLFLTSVSFPVNRRGWKKTNLMGRSRNEPGQWLTPVILATWEAETRRIKATLAK
jgi:hypothetical protein